MFLHSECLKQADSFHSKVVKEIQNYLQLKKASEDRKMHQVGVHPPAPQNVLELQIFPAL